MIPTGFSAQAQVSASERGAQFRYQLFSGISAIAETLSKLTVAAISFPGPVRVLMGKRRVVRDVFLERLKRRHLNVILRRPIVGLVATVAEIGANVTEERFGVLDSLKLGSFRIGFRRVTVHLGGIEHRVSACEQ